jgi:hypothetical protein
MVVNIERIFYTVNASLSLETKPNLLKHSDLIRDIWKPRHKQPRILSE